MAGLKGLKKRRRVQIILVAFVALGLSTALVGYAMKDGINLYRSPTQVATKPPGKDEVFKLGGMVVEGSLTHGADGALHFEVTDTKSTTPVVFNGVPPDLFAEGAGMVGTGKMQDGTFVATEILAKHDEKYNPKEVVDIMKAQGVDITMPPKPTN
jgi:cytochrome c-type biogenesis protein CcmE